MDALLQRTREALNTNRGIVLGENHLTPVVPDWVRSNLSTLRESGVTTLFMEIKDHRQPFIDNFFAGQISEDELRNAINGMNDTAFENLIIEAKNQGIRVIAMDLEDPTQYIRDRNGGWVRDEYDNDRLTYSNPIWAQRITEYMSLQPDAGRYVVIAGMLHTNPDASSPQRGVDAMLGIPSIDVYTAAMASSANNSQYPGLQGLLPEGLVLSE
ncbi:MAG: ChaN family lipoprotein [Rickettsiales bacterium]